MSISPAPRFPERAPQIYERKVYQMLQGKVDTHERLVDLYKEELGI